MVPSDGSVTDLGVPCEQLPSDHSVSSDQLTTGQPFPYDTVSSNETATKKQTIDTVNKPVAVIPGPSMSSLSDLLVFPEITTSTESKRNSSQARLLTSDENLKLLEEIENKKKSLLMEKERKKQERANKKKEREEALKKKQAKKAEEKAKKAAEKQTKGSTKVHKKNNSTTQQDTESCKCGTIK